MLQENVSEVYLAEHADWISEKVEATHNLVELPQQRADVVVLQRVRQLYQVDTRTHTHARGRI